MGQFDYAEPAEIFASRYRRARAGAIIYRRFDTAAAAIQFAMEEIPAELATGTFLEVGDERLGHTQIKMLYEDAAFPLSRHFR
jgi:hypothetical protein